MTKVYRPRECGRQAVWGHMAAFLDAGVPCLSVPPETCLPIPAFGCNSIALNESLLSGLQLQLPKSSVVNWR